jgi:hypothetical protein
MRDKQTVTSCSSWWSWSKAFQLMRDRQKTIGQMDCSIIDFQPMSGQQTITDQLIQLESKWEVRK